MYDASESHKVHCEYIKSEAIHKMFFSFKLVKEIEHNIKHFYTRNICCLRKLVVNECIHVHVYMKSEATCTMHI